MNKDERSQFTSRLEAERRRRGWSQTELAAKAGLTPADISRYERGWARPYPRQAARLASILGIPPNQLTDRVDPNGRVRTDDAVLSGAVEGAEKGRKGGVQHRLDRVPTRDKNPLACQRQRAQR